MKKSLKSSLQLHWSLAAVLTLGFAILISSPVFAAAPVTKEDSAAAAEEAEVEEEKGPELPWVRDIVVAKRQAKKEGKDLFINFTGSDWCGWCIRLDEEVFSEAEFIEEATKKYVFVFLDFPNSKELKAEVVNPKVNSKLSKAYGVAGFPTVILTTADGKPYGRTGYKKGGPKAYLESLNELHKGGVAIKLLLADTTRKDTKALVAAFPVLAKQELLSYPAYKWVFKAAVKADPDGKLNLLPIVKKEQERRLAAAELKKLQALFPKNRKDKPNFGKIAGFILKSKHLKGGQLLNVGFQVTGILIQSERFDLAKKLLDHMAKDSIMDEEPRAKKAIESFMARLKTAQAAAAATEDENKEE